jgi:hypothetical protein
MGERGRSALVAHHEQRLCCNLWFELIRDLVRPAEGDNSGASSPPRQRGRAAQAPHGRRSAASVVPHLTIGL